MSSTSAASGRVEAMRIRLPIHGVRRRRWTSMGSILATLVLTGGWAWAGEPVDYSRQVKPVLKQRCYACHGALKQKAGLRLDTGASIRRGGESGPAVEPGQAGESLLIERVTETDPALRMPPEGSPLSGEQVV